MILVHEISALKRLKYLSNKFAEFSIRSLVLEKNHLLDMSTLVVSAEEDYKGREQIVNLAYLLNHSEEEANVMLLQFYTELPVELEATQIPLVEALVSFINTRMPMGHFGFQNCKLHYRYVMVDSKASKYHALQTVETFMVYVSILNHFHEAIESVIQGKMTLATLKANF